MIYFIKDIGWEEKEEVHINIRQIWSLDPILPSPDWTLRNFVLHVYEKVLSV